MTKKKAIGAVGQSRRWRIQTSRMLRGLSFEEQQTLLRRTTDTILAKKSEDIAELPGYASPEEGLAALLSAEGGCVSVDEACRLYRKPNPVAGQTLTAAIRRGYIVGYQANGGRYWVPVWQFRPEGGVIKGLREVLHAMREKVPGYNRLSPFTFFLQPDRLTDLRTPLTALRDGDIKKVLAAANDLGH